MKNPHQDFQHPRCEKTVICLLIKFHACLLVGAAALAQAQTDDALLAEAAGRGPAVATLLDLPREKPADRLTAIFTLLDLGEDDVAAALFQPLIQAELNDQNRAALVGKFGTARFLNLARREKPESNFAGARPFVESCLKAAAAQARDPQRLVKLIASLNDTSPKVRKAAQVDLAATGVMGAAACIQALAQADDPPARANLMFALASMRPEVDALLIAALAKGDSPLQRDVAELAGHLKLLDATPWLAAIAAGAESDSSTVAAAQTALTKLGLSQPNVSDARAILLSEIARLETGALSDRTASNETALWWSFDADKRQFTRRKLPADQRLLLAIARLTQTLERLPGASAEDRRLALIYAQQAAQSLGEELPPYFQSLVEAMSPDDLNKALAEAMRQNHLGAAIVNIKWLGNRGDPTALFSSKGKPSPLAGALEHPHAEVRFAALESIMRLMPQRSFAGASGVPKSLWDFVASADTARASQSLAWVAQLLEGGHPYDEMLRDARRAGRTLYTPQLTEPSLRVLALLGTAGSQTTLIDFASQRTMSIESRRHAAEAFAVSVRRFGILQTTTQIIRQYNRYNASETADLETQQVLGQLLDTLESRRQSPDDS